MFEEKAQSYRVKDKEIYRVKLVCQNTKVYRVNIHLTKGTITLLYFFCFFFFLHMRTLAMLDKYRANLLGPCRARAITLECGKSGIKMDEFEECYGIPQVMGAIDGCHIEINAPPNNQKDYFNRKQHYSVNLQVIVNSNLKFMHVTVGYPCSIHDARVLRLSGLYELAEKKANS